MTVKEARLRAIDEYEVGFNRVMDEVRPRLLDPRTALAALAEFKLRLDALRAELVKAWERADLLE